ncbi:MAG TPA: RGCVC family protein [Pseudonocardia sp.]|jgi:hypothetical protein|nr:RGCVC family protein [Pseudonocardia sp.]
MRSTRETSTVPSSAAARPHLVCSVCPHEWGAHDPIGTRYCSATINGGLRRGCVCVKDVPLFGQPTR